MATGDEATKRQVWAAVRAGRLWPGGYSGPPFVCSLCGCLGEPALYAGCVPVATTDGTIEQHVAVCRWCVDVLINACAPPRNQPEAEKASAEEARPKLPFEPQAFAQIVTALKRCSPDGYLRVIVYDAHGAPVTCMSLAGTGYFGPSPLRYRDFERDMERFSDAPRPGAPEQPPQAEPAPAAAQSTAPSSAWTGPLGRRLAEAEKAARATCDSPDAPHNPELWDAILLAEELRVKHNGIGGVYLYLGHDGDNGCTLKDSDAKPVAKGGSGRSLLEAIQRAVTDRNERRSRDRITFAVGDEVVRADGIGGLRLMRVVKVTGDQVTCEWEDTIFSMGLRTISRAHMAMTVTASALKRLTVPPTGNPAGDARG